MSDVRFERIELRGIRAWGHHGANAGEADVPQLLLVDVVLDADLHRARTSDELGDTIDYARLHAAIVELVRTRRCRLLERLAELILEGLMADPRVAAVRVSIAKPGLLDGATPVVTLSRIRPELAGRAVTIE